MESDSAVNRRAGRMITGGTDRPKAIAGYLSGRRTKVGALVGSLGPSRRSRAAVMSGRTVAGGASRGGHLESEVRGKRRESAGDGKNLRKKNQRKIKSRFRSVY